MEMYKYADVITADWQLQQVFNTRVYNLENSFK